MASSENQQQTPNPAPPSSSAGGHEMRDYYAARAGPRPTSQQEPYLTPYLGLRARLSQTWINRWTILLLLVLIRTLIAIATLDDNLGSARRQSLSACTALETAGSAMASMPHYMSSGVNELSAQGIERAIQGLMQMLILSITTVEEIVVFIINLLTQTYICLITFAVSGSLHAAIEVAEHVGDFLNSTVKGIGDELAEAGDGFEDTMNGFLSGLNDVGSFLSENDDKKPPTIDLSDEIDELNDLHLPDDYDRGLKKLNDSIPNFEEVNNFTQNAIRFPFREVKYLINDSLPTYTMNRSMFPVPAKEKLAFCSDDNGINDFFDDLRDIKNLAKKIFLGVIITLCLLAMIPMAWREFRRWRIMKERAQIIKNEAFDPMDAVYIVSRPYTSSFGLKIADRFKSRRRQTLVRWSVAYATTDAALFVLALGVAGLLACLCQYILLQAMVKEVPKLQNQVTAFSDKVYVRLDDASQAWAVGTNSMIEDTNADINRDVFGWVETSTTAVNDTLNTFVDEMTDTLNSTFGDTILYDPIMEVLNCLILLKVEGIQKGLTWVHDHAHIDFPILPKDTFSLGAAQKMVDDDDDMFATGKDGDTANAITSAVLWVIRAIESSIRQEAIISTCIVLIWVLIALIGIGRAVFLMFKGGNQGVHQGPIPGKGPLPGAQHELTSFDQPRVPTYEQATRDSRINPSDNGANKYNGQSYTLEPRPPPTLEYTSATSPIHTGFSPSAEKLGNVNGQPVDAAIRRQTHVRSSSYGDYAVTSPESAIPQSQPSGSHLQLPPDQKQNPFADPPR